MSALIAFVLSLLLCRWLLSARSPLRILDTPNERSLHAAPTPRTGGVAIICASFAAWGLMAWLGGMPASMVWIAAAALLVAGISFVDDLLDLSALVRIIVHGLAALLLVGSELVLFDGWIGALFTWFAIVWMLNLYNFMDGMDGFAGGMALFGFGFMAVAGWMQGAIEYALYASVVAAAAAGFLTVNFPPARIFMGDVGSATLGLLAAAFGLWGIRDHLFDWWFPLLLFSPFVIDATVTLMRRIIRRERIWEAHRSHYYQRLVRLGWGHKKTVLAEYALMAAAGGSALFALHVDSPLVTKGLLIGWAVIYLFIAIRVDRRSRELA